MIACRILAKKSLNIIMILPVVFLSLLSSPGMTEEQDAPAAVVERLNNALIESMKGGRGIGFEGRCRILAPVVKDVFAMEAMTRISSGKHWDHFSPEQRQSLIELYTKWSTSNFADNFDSYAGQRFEVTSGETVGNRAEVKSRFIKKDGERVFLYKLARLDGRWRIVDIHLEGVSQLANTRAQFVSILDRSGCEGLIQSLKEKIQKLSTEGEDKAPVS